MYSVSLSPLPSPADQMQIPYPLIHDFSGDHPWPRAYHLVPRFGALAARISGDMTKSQVLYTACNLQTLKSKPGSMTGRAESRDQQQQQNEQGLSGWFRAPGPTVSVGDCLQTSSGRTVDWQWTGVAFHLTCLFFPQPLGLHVLAPERNLELVQRACDKA